MIFNASPDASLIFKERLLWLLFLAPFFFLVYGSANQLTAFNDFVPSIMYDWEKSIPFIPEMIVPYMSVDLLFGFSFLLVKTRDEIQRHALRLGFTIAFSVLIFLIIPLHLSLVKPPIEGWTKPIFAALSSDLPYNQLPSLHVSLAMVVGHVYFTHLKGIWRWLSVSWFVLIILSILFVYQHHFIDLPAGLLAGLFAFFIIPVKGKTRIPLHFVSPKHLHISLYYLFPSLFFTVLAFRISPFSLSLAFISGWVAIGFLFIASLYAMGYNPITLKNKGRIQWPYWAIFWPYLLGNRLSWQIWKRKVPAMVQVADGIWLGRSLDSADKALLDKNDIKTIIDLAPEINTYATPKVKIYYQPLLDLVIPSPVLLHEITDKITQAKQQGNVYVHCKFGLSRSVMASCAWLITQGYSKQEAWQIVSNAQHHRVDKPYVHIALELFEEQLRNR